VDALLEPRGDVSGPVANGGADLEIGRTVAESPPSANGRHRQTGESGELMLVEKIFKERDRR
jgi:hypothetical protein